jgi:hypothetical protein
MAPRNSTGCGYDTNNFATTEPLSLRAVMVFIGLPCLRGYTIIITTPSQIFMHPKIKRIRLTHFSSSVMLMLS